MEGKPENSQPSDVWPNWLVSLDRLLSVHPQFVLSGNIRDHFLTPIDDTIDLQPIVQCLWERLSSREIEFLLVYDQVSGVRVFPDAARDKASQLSGVDLGSEGHKSVSIDKLPDWLESVTNAKDIGCGFVIDYASRLVGSPQNLSQTEREFFGACEKLLHTTMPVRAAHAGGLPSYNPVIWLIDRPNDLPDWFAVGNEALKTLSVPIPDHQTRQIAASKIAERFVDYDGLPKKKRESYIDLFADFTDGLGLRSMFSISQLAREQDFPLAEISDAVRSYKVGLTESPWKQEYLREEIRTGEAQIEKRVMGQSQAVRKALDILKRSVMGLSGAQASSKGGRPRGVLFFAGPTGVGKTELAKSITELLSGDEESYIRFDMSEFSAEHSAARLIGSPPGYVGYDSGGELVNAIRRRPFSVVLFDEIEKAHPRILDKFLQILEDGRLTDGRGDTVYFSEAVIVFTSNLGIYVEDKLGNRILNVSPKDRFDEVQDKVREAIENHFRFQLLRPELLNRIGENIVVFDFIRSDVASAIFEKMVGNVKARVKEQQGISIELGPDARSMLHKWCTEDLGHGGRGIGNKLETTFINPLARALFAAPTGKTTTLRIKRVAEANGNYEVELE